jgi:hypothetical protein
MIAPVLWFTCVTKQAIQVPSDGELYSSCCPNAKLTPLVSAGLLCGAGQFCDGGKAPAPPVGRTTGLLGGAGQFCDVGTAPEALLISTNGIGSGLDVGMGPWSGRMQLICCWTVIHVPGLISTMMDPVDASTLETVHRTHPPFVLE